MLKNILNVDGAQVLTVSEQKKIGGGNAPAEGKNCPTGYRQCEPWGACLKLSIPCS